MGFGGSPLGGSYVWRTDEKVHVDSQYMVGHYVCDESADVEWKKLRNGQKVSKDDEKKTQ